MGAAFSTELKSLLQRLDGEPAEAIESESLECKGWDPDPRERQRQVRAIREAVVCLANARGGTILLGVADRKRSRREAIQDTGDLDLLDLRRTIYDGTSPPILVEIEELREPEGRILLLRVPQGLPPHTTSEGVAKIRVGRECKPLTGAELVRLVAQGGQRDPTAEPVSEASLDDLDPAALEILRSALAEEGGKPDLARRALPELLEAIGLSRGGEVTLAALLLLGRRAALARWAPSHEVIFLRLRSATSYDARHDLRGPILVILEDLRRLFEAHLRVAPIQADLFVEIQVPDLTGWTAREAVLNAFAHRDYFLRQSIHIEVREDRIVVASPGGFLGGITPENVLRHAPVRRNALLAEIFQQIGLVNRAGLGVDRIYEELLSLGKGLPRYEADESTVRLTLPTRTHEPFARFVARERRQGRSLDLDDLILLRVATERGQVDRWSAARVLQLGDEEEAAARLISLRERGLLQPRGRGRGTVYLLPPHLSDQLRGVAATDLDFPLDEEAVRLRVLAELRERGRVTNEEVRRLGGFSRHQALKLLRALRAEGLVMPMGQGRGAYYAPGSRLKADRSRRRLETGPRPTGR